MNREVQCQYYIWHSALKHYISSNSIYKGQIDSKWEGNFNYAICTYIINVEIQYPKLRVDFN